ncbi:MAG: NAD(P)-binding protein [Acidimicrobiia bacterium]
MSEGHNGPPQRVAIIGGGVAGLFSALMLSDPRLGGRFDVTIYTRGWRLGGKCASGRNPHEHERIEEHGLHLWFGFYENALGWTRRALEDLPPELRARYRSFDEAFLGIDDVVLFEEWPNHEQVEKVSAMRLHFPVDPHSAGGQAVPTLGATVRRVADVLAETAKVMFSGAMPFGPSRAFARLVGVGARLGARLVPRHLGAVPGARPGPVTGLRLWVLLRLLGLSRRVTWALLRPASGSGEGRRRQIATGVDLLHAALKGIVEDDLLVDGFGKIDGVELREWLAGHGASPVSLNSGSVLWALYDLVFGYHRGDSWIPELAAGKALLALLRLLGGYHGHFGYRMASSMGEVAIAPMYDLLRDRGVHVGFFRDLRAVHLDGAGDLASVELHEQADVPVDGYDPFRWTGPDGGHFWSIEPDWSQIDLDPSTVTADALENGLPVRPDEPRRTLRVGHDVDHVLLCVPIPVLAADPVLSEELRRVPAWQRAIEHSASVATAAYQIWSDAEGSVPVVLNDRFGGAIVSSYDQPFSTYCPMDQLAAVECWQGPRPVRIGYGCGVWPEDPAPPADAADAVPIGTSEPGGIARLSGSSTSRTMPNGMEPAASLGSVQKEAATSLDVLEKLPDPPRDGLRALVRRATAVAPPSRIDPTLPPAAGADAPRVARFLEGPEPAPPGRDSKAFSSRALDPGSGEHHTLWVRLNDQPAHRYVTTPPTNPWYRIEPDDTGVGHLWAAGDWTANLIDGGCVEGTVISALRASRGIARAAGVADEVIADVLPVVGEGTWLYQGGRGGPPPTVRDSAFEAPALAGALTAVPGPYASDSTTLYTWLAEVDPQRAAAVARRCFDELTGGAVRVEPIGSLALLTAGDISSVSSESPAYRALGRLSEKQVVVWLPCRVHWDPTAAHRRPEPPAFALFVPYIWVDNPMSLTTGREGLGWPKAMADFDPVDGLSLPLSLSVYGLERYSPDSAARGGLPLLSITASAGEGAGEVADEVVSVAELGVRLAAAAAEAFGGHGAEAIGAIVEALRERGLPQLFAKSLIAADDDARNDFNEIVTAQATVRSWGETRLLGPCELVVHDVASHPLRTDLGLQSQRLPFGFRIELDFVQESGAVRWSSWASPAQRRDRARLLRRARAFGLRGVTAPGTPSSTRRGR